VDIYNEINMSQSIQTEHKKRIITNRLFHSELPPYE
jgi:hypothetical protein